MIARLSPNLGVIPYRLRGGRVINAILLGNRTGRRTGYEDMVPFSPSESQWNCKIIKATNGMVSISKCSIAENCEISDYIVIRPSCKIAEIVNEDYEPGFGSVYIRPTSASDVKILGSGHLINDDGSKQNDFLLMVKMGTEIFVRPCNACVRSGYVLIPSDSVTQFPVFKILHGRMNSESLHGWVDIGGSMAKQLKF